MIELKGVSFSYNSREQFIENLNLNFEANQITTVIGPNGCGKSTVLKLSSRLLLPQKGQVLFKGSNIASMKAKDYAKKVSAVLQQPPGAEMTVEQLVMAGRYPYQSYFKKQTEEDFYFVDEALQLTHCSSLRHRQLRQLSGGELQRAYIAMILAQNTEVIFLDEPTSSLDISICYEVMELLLQLKMKHKKTIVMVLHDLNLALKYADKVIILDQGRLVAKGSCEEIQSSGAIQRIFGVEMKCFSDGRKKYYCFDQVITAGSSHFPDD